MLRKVTALTLVLLFAMTQLFALEGFERKGTIPIPEKDLNNGGVGNMISGVDIDEDGKKEIYLVNDNWRDGETEVIPRIYKLEDSGAGYEVVWSAELEPFYQNTWPCLSIADLDKDGKKELVWGPVNSTAVSSNPNRVVVFEHAGGDVFGVDDGAGGYAPNSAWTITTEDDVNLRPMDWEITDIDDDGIDEIIFADRKGTSSGYFFGVMSVDDIPDDADGSETWTLELSAKDFPFFNGDAENKWDVATIGNSFYAFCEVEISKVTWTGSDWEYTSLKPMAGGSANQSAVGVDLDSDGTEEIIAGIYDWGDDTQKGIVLLQEDGDTLKHTPLVNVADYFVDGSRGLWGIDHGDIDGDGYLDFIFGSRAGVTNGQIFRLAYRGGDITDPANYEFTKIDEGYADEGGVWSVVNIADIDDDPEREVLYTSSASYGGSIGVPDTSAPVIVLDYTEGWLGDDDDDNDYDNLVIAEKVVFAGDAPENLITKPGRILDGGNVVWFMAVDGTNKETWVFRSNDGGETFSHNATAIAGRGAQMDAFDENIALVSCANGKVYRTTDGGENWSEAYSYNLGLGDGWFDGLRVVNSTTAIAYGDGVSDGDMHFARTTDKGESWTEIEGIDYLSSVWGYYTWGAAACNVGESVWMTGYNGNDEAFVFRSYDAGENWESFAVDTAVTDRIRAIAMINDNNGLATVDGGGLIKTTDGGETWANIALPANAGWVNGVAAVPNSDYIFLFDDGGVFLTDDLGGTFAQISVPTDVSENDYFTAGVFQNVDYGYVFTYYGATLKFEDQEPEEAQEMDALVVADEVQFTGDRPENLITKPGRILEGGKVSWFMAVDGTNKETWAFRSNDGGESFTHNATAIPGRGAQLDAFDENIALVACANGKVYRTTDGGVNWTEAYSYNLGLGDGWFDGLRVVNSTTAIAYGDGLDAGAMHFARTTDKGETWSEIDGIDYLNSVWGYYTWGAAACNVGESVWMTGYNSNDEAFVFRSYDAGENWESFAVDTAVTDRIRAIAMINDNDGLATVDGGAVIKTTDGGETWEHISLPANAGWVNGVASVPNTNYIYLFDDGGVFLTNDLGATYTEIMVPTDVKENDYFTAGAFSEKDFGYVFTYYGEVLRFENQQPNAIDNKEEINVADQYVLNQNYPNPFNPTTKISFSIPKTEKIKVVVYDMRGQKVATLFNATMNAGYHTLEWNGLDDNGKVAATGVYLYQLQTPNKVKTRKMTFIK